jgi:DNA-binding MarR family transcriptional regulator
VRVALPPDARQTAEGLEQLGAVLRASALRAGASRGRSGAQERILKILAAAPQGLRLGAVASALGVSPASASDSLRLLVRRGSVRRRRSKEDARAAFFSLTPRGSAVREKGEGGVGSAGTADPIVGAIESLPPSDRSALQRGLIQLILLLQDRGAIPVARACVNCRFFRPFAHRSAGAPHHCEYVDRAFGDAALRSACPEFESTTASDAARRGERWRAGRNPGSLSFSV